MISTRCCWPTLMSSTRASGSTSKRNVFAMSATLRSAAASSRKIPSRTGSVPSTMFSATVITGMSMKCWCTIPMPAWIASRAEENETDLPFSRISPSVGPVEPVEDVHERRLARAVLAEQRVHLAAAHVERDVVVRDDARELLADAPHLEDELVEPREG